jgi:hypothetical protein
MDKLSVGMGAAQLAESVIFLHDAIDGALSKTHPCQPCAAVAPLVKDEHHGPLFNALHPDRWPR